MASKTTTTTTTISMQSLNKLYFTFLQKYVTPNLTKIVTEVQNLLIIKNTYQVYRYLEQMTKEVEKIDSNVANTSVTNTNNNHYPPKNNIYYQYALPISIDNNKTHQFSNNLNKSLDKTQQNSMNFKSKTASKRTSINNNSNLDDPTKTFDLYKAKSQQQKQPKLLKTQSITNDYQNDYKIQYEYSSAKRNISYMPSISSNNKIEYKDNQIDTKMKNMKNIVKKISKIFNDNHSKIQKYNKNSQINKIYNLNGSTKIQKKQQGININNYK